MNTRVSSRSIFVGNQSFGLLRDERLRVVECVDVFDFFREWGDDFDICIINIFYLTLNCQTLSFFIAQNLILTRSIVLIDELRMLSSRTKKQSMLLFQILNQLMIFAECRVYRVFQY